MMDGLRRLVGGAAMAVLGGVGAAQAQEASAEFTQGIDDISAAILQALPTGAAPAAEELAAGAGADSLAETTGSGDNTATEPSDQERWAALSATAASRIQSDQASTFSLTQLRGELVTWRDRFLDQQSVNAGRISTVQAQLEALGAAPAEGGTEDEQVSARRSALQDQLAQLKAPVLLAQERYSEASGLISEIDSVLRGRQTSHLTQRAVSPLNPAHWAEALGVLGAVIAAAATEVTDALTNSARLQAAKSNLPFALAMALGGILLIWRGRHGVARGANRMMRRAAVGHRAVGFLASLVGVLLPVIGIFLLCVALLSLQLFGPVTEMVINCLPGIGVIWLLSSWFSAHYFDEDDPGPLQLDPHRARLGRWLTMTMGTVLGVDLLLTALLNASEASTDLRGVVIFPTMAVVAWLLWGLGGVLRLPAPPETEDEHPAVPYLLRLASWVGQGMRIAAVAGAGLAVFGYTSGGAALLYPAVSTLAVFGAVVLLQRLIEDLLAVLSRGGADGSGLGLLSILGGAVLTVLTLPVLALVWGAQVSDLTELWARFREGFQLGETRISPTDFLTFAMVFAVGYMATRLVQGLLRSSVLPKTKLDKGGQNAIVSGFGYIGIFLAALIAITTAGIDLSSLAIVAGALSVGIGFGLQNVVSNFVSGIILLIERPVSEGDWIEVGGQSGIVQDISVRSTRIQTFDRTDVIVPNADLVSGVVTNWTHGNSVGRVIVPVGVAYGSDTKRIAEILKEIASSHPMVLLRPEPQAVFVGFGASSLDFEIRAILRDVNWVLSVGSDLRHAIAERFAAEGIEIPFPQQDLWFRNAAPQTPGPDGQGPEPSAAGGAPVTQPNDLTRPESSDDLGDAGGEDAPS